MKTPRNLNGRDLVKHLSVKGNAVTRQTDSHICLTTQEDDEHHITIPDHKPLSVGTLSNILKSVSNHFGIEKNELMDEIFNTK